MAPIIRRRDIGIVLVDHIRVLSFGSMPTAANPTISPDSIASFSESIILSASVVVAHESGIARILLMTVV